MNTIYRYAINNATGVNDINLPNNAQVLSAGVAINPETGVEEVCVWAMVNNNNAVGTRRFLVFGTGADMTQTENFNLKFIGTVQKANRYAFHVFEVTEFNY